MRDKPLKLFTPWGRNQTPHYYQGYGWIEEHRLCSQKKEKPRGNGARKENKQ